MMVPWDFGSMGTLLASPASLATSQPFNVDGRGMVVRLDAAAVLAYDHRLGKAARAVGLQVIAPGTAHT